MGVFTVCDLFIKIFNIALTCLEAERKKTLKVKFGLKMSNSSNNKQTAVSSTNIVNKKPSIFNQQDDDDVDGEHGADIEKNVESGFKPNKGMCSNVFVSWLRTLLLIFEFDVLNFL